MIRENLTKNNSKSLNNKIRLIDSVRQYPNNLNEQYSINDKIKTTLNNKNRKRNKISNPQPAEFDGRLASSVAIILLVIRFSLRKTKNLFSIAILIFHIHPRVLALELYMKSSNFWKLSHLPKISN